MDRSSSPHDGAASLTDARPRLIQGYKVVMALLFLVVLIDGFDNSLIGQVAPGLMKNWSIPPAELSGVFAAGLFGVAVGAFLSGPLADRFGRKTLTVLPVLLFGVCQLLSSRATTLNELAVFRFLAGIGFGGAMPVAVTAMAEFSPPRLRALAVNCISLSTPLGQALTGVAAYYFLAPWGWSGLLAASAVVPLVLAVILVLFLPESAPGRAARPATEAKAGLAAPSPIALLFSGKSRIVTACLWPTCFFNLLAIFFMASWLPILLRTSGISAANSSLLTSVTFFAAASGCVASGLLMSRINPCLLLVLSTAGAALGFVLVGQAIGAEPAIAASVAMIGFALAVTGGGLNYIASISYPSAARATGVGWMLGVGRIGAIVGSLAGGRMLQSGLGLPLLFAANGVPLLISTVLMFVLYTRQRTGGFWQPASSLQPSTAAT